MTFDARTYIRKCINIYFICTDTHLQIYAFTRDILMYTWYIFYIYTMLRLCTIARVIHADNSLLIIRGNILPSCDGHNYLNPPFVNSQQPDIILQRELKKTVVFANRGGIIEGNITHVRFAGLKLRGNRKTLA